MKSGALSRVFFVIVLTMALALPPASTAQAATLVVTNANDSGPGSLREAIVVAAVGDTITFDGDYTITLSNPLVVNKRITITGAGHQVTISGNHVTRVFLIPYGDYSGGYPTFDHLTIADGNHNIDDCFGSAVGCGGGMGLDLYTGAVITNSVFTGNTASLAGGAIYAYWADLTITNTTFANNFTTAYGGAVHCFYCDMTLTNNTFYGNTVNGYGSAFLNTWGTVTLRNNLFIKGATNINLCDSDVSSGGALIDGGGNVRWGDASCPGTTADPLVGALGDYGGGVRTLPLLPGSGALGAAAANCPDFDARGVARTSPCDAGAFESSGFSLIKSGGDNQSAPIRASFANPLVVSVAPNFAADPVNGGVVTFTAPSFGASLTSTSIPVTISGGSATWNVTANAIIGGPYTVTVSTTGANNAVFSLTNTCLAAVTVISNADSGVGSLRQAITDVCAGGTITFAPNLSGQTITLTSGPLAVAKSMTITGPEGAPGLAVSGNNAARVFEITAGQVNLANLTIRDGISSAERGGAGLYINNHGTAVTLNNSTLTANLSNGSGTGGAVVIEVGASLALNNSTISGNHAVGASGGIFNMGTLAANSSTITGNTSTGSSGGIFSQIGSTVVLRNTILAGNTGWEGNAADCFTMDVVPMESGGYNIIGPVTGTEFEASATDLTNINFADLHLGPLQNNGGSTATHALLKDSLAIDLIPGCNAGPDTDQRGIHRPQGARCDAGAFELVDNVAPDTTIDSGPANPTISTGASFTFSGNDVGSGVSSFECRLDGAAFSPCASGITYNDLTRGNHTFEVRAIDRLGNIDATPASFAWRILYPLYLPLAAG